jgi:hypothetical protein
MARGRLRHVTLTAAAPAPRFVACEQLGRRSSPLVVLAINEGERLLVRVADDEAGGGFFKRSSLAGSGGVSGIAF